MSKKGKESYFTDSENETFSTKTIISESDDENEVTTQSKSTTDGSSNTSPNKTENLSFSKDQVKLFVDSSSDDDKIESFQKNKTEMASNSSYGRNKSKSDSDFNVIATKNITFKKSVVESYTDDDDDDDDDHDGSTNFLSENTNFERNENTLDSDVSVILTKNIRRKKYFSDSDTNDDDNNVAVTKNIRQKKYFSESDSNDSDDDNNKSKHFSSTDHKENDEILEITQKLSESIISDDFKIDNGNQLVNSTTCEFGNQIRQLNPRLSSYTKRSLNKSFDTPRIIKHKKDSTTPLNPENLLLPSVIKPKIENLNFSDDDDVIEVSSDEEVAFTRKPLNKSQKEGVNGPGIKENVIVNLKGDIANNKFSPQKKIIDNADLKSNDFDGQKVEIQETREVSLNEYRIQNNIIATIKSDIQKTALLLRTAILDQLPDKGLAVRRKHQDLEKQLLDEVKKLSTMKITKETEPENIKTKILSWNDIQTQATAVQPRTFGKQALSTYNAQKAVTMERLQQLHGSLATRPKEKDFVDDPKGLKVELMNHQKHALAWMIWREKQKPSGGILADDMGLGKTLTMISLVIKTNNMKEELEEADNSDSESESEKSNKPIGGTLVICPASLINQWSSEVDQRTKRGLLSCEVYHGPKRESKPKRLAQHDMVITTYSIVNNECEKRGTIFRVKWQRIIIDEAHQIRNHKSQTSVAVCKLSAKSRWALTGTPVHNKELDMYALLKYLRCTPFDDLVVWKRWVGDKSTGGQERLHTVISSLMLRRTKVELMEKGSLQNLPERKWELIAVKLSKPELDIYNRILIFSRKLFAQFLHQRAEKDQDAKNMMFEASGALNYQPNEEYFKMREKLLNLNKVKDIKQHEILLLLLRLRQICCHPSLIKGMLHEDLEELGGDDPYISDHSAEFDLLDQLNNLVLDDDEHNPNSSQFLDGGAINSEPLKLKEAARGLLNSTNPVFSKETMSSKIRIMLKVLQEKVLANNDKAIIVSQWSSYLKIIAFHLKQERIQFDQLDGTVPVNKRMEMVDSFNNPNHKMKVLLLSLTAGGVGLNLVGGNHLFLLDLHWNPQLENQAQDRIYRMGQTKSVFIYKFMAEDTIEKRILGLQEKKLEIAQSMLTGTKQVSQNKLSLQDLKMLFEM